MARVLRTTLPDGLFHVTTKENLSAGMKRLNGVYAQRFNARHGRRGHLWGDRFASKVIDTEEYLRDAIEYVRFNPCAAGLCEHPDDWPWTYVYRVDKHPFE